MSGLGWEWPLEEGEALLWQGRPAPRCYTWRNWKLALAATMLFLASSFWWMLAYQLMVADGYPWWLQLIPAPLVLLSIWYGPVNILLARARWEKLFYALSDNRLMFREGLFTAKFETFPLSEIVAWQQKTYSEQLVSLRMELKNSVPVVLFCLEQPQSLLGHLQREIKLAEPAAKDESV